MIRGYILRRLNGLQRNLFTARNGSSSSVNIEKLEEETELDLEVVDQEAQLREEEIQKKRNKSRLYEQHRNIVHGIVPYNNPKLWVHGTVKYQRKMYGRYGQASGVNPEICWPTKQEMLDKLEYEKVAHPSTIPEMIEAARINREDKENKTQQRQKQIAAKMLKLDDWSRELRNKIAKKEADAKAAKERKEKLVEDVRRHFGYTIDPRDEKFKEMLERKEKEQKKAVKEARKKAREDKITVKLVKKNEEEPIKTEDSDVKNS